MIVSISLSWLCPAFNNNSHSSLVYDYFQFLLTIHLYLSSLHAFHSIHHYPSCFPCHPSFQHLILFVAVFNFPFFSFFSVHSLKLSAYHSSLTLQFTLHFLFNVPYSVSNFLFAHVALLVQYAVIVSISLSWLCPAFNNNSHSSLVYDYFQFLLTIHLYLSSLHAFHSIHHYPSCFPCHPSFQHLILFVAVFNSFTTFCFVLYYDCHSMCTCYSMDTFPIPHAPARSLPQSRCLIHIISCRCMVVASLIMPSFQFPYATCPIFATHFTTVCHSSHTFYLLHASYPLFNHLLYFLMQVTLYF